MRKIVLLLVICVFVLCGCSTNDVNTTTENNTEQYYNENNSTQSAVTDEDETSVVGLWKHSEYPNAYSIRINSLDGRIMNLTIEAVKGNYSQIATAEIDDAYFNNNKTKFAFVDSFNNSGLCEIKIIGDEMTVSYERNTPYQGGWCIDAGAGTYKKAEATAGMSNYEKNGAFSGGYVENSTTEESVIPASRFFDSGKYAKVMGYGYDGDVYDKDIYYQFDWPNDGEFIYNNYSDNSYGRDEFGKYKVLTSDRPNYNFKLIFDYTDGHQEIFYVKTVIDRIVFDFYLENDTPYSRFENYDNYAVKRSSPDGKTYHFRYDYEYKEYQEGIRSTPMESPFKDIS